MAAIPRGRGTTGESAAGHMAVELSKSRLSYRPWHPSRPAKEVPGTHLLGIHCYEADISIASWSRKWLRTEPKGSEDRKTLAEGGRGRSEEGEDPERREKPARECTKRSQGQKTIKERREQRTRPTERKEGGSSSLQTGELSIANWPIILCKSAKCALRSGGLCIANWRNGHRKMANCALRTRGMGTASARAGNQVPLFACWRQGHWQGVRGDRAPDALAIANPLAPHNRPAGERWPIRPE
eukprot:gene17209-biopygen2529